MATFSEKNVTRTSEKDHDQGMGQKSDAGKEWTNGVSSKNAGEGKGKIGSDPESMKAYADEARNYFKSNPEFVDKDWDSASQMVEAYNERRTEDPDYQAAALNLSTGGGNYDFSSFVDEDLRNRKWTQPTGTGAERFHVGYTPEEQAAQMNEMNKAFEEYQGGVEIGGKRYLPVNEIDEKTGTLPVGGNPNKMLRQVKGFGEGEEPEYEPIYRDEKANTWHSGEPDRKFGDKIASFLNKAVDNYLSKNSDNEIQNGARQASEQMQEKLKDWTEKRQKYIDIKNDIETNGPTETPGITKAEEDARKAEEAKKAAETKAEAPKSEPAKETPKEEPKPEEPKTEPEPIDDDRAEKFADLLSTDNSDPEINEFLDSLGYTRTERRDEIVRQAKELGNIARNENITTGTKLKEVGTRVKQILDTATGKDVYDQLSDVPIIGNLLAAARRGASGVAGLLELLFNSLGLSEYTGRLMNDLDLTNHNKDGYERSYAASAGDVPDRLYDTTSRYDPNLANNGLGYNKGLKKEAYSDEQVKGFVRTMVRGQPHVRKLANKFRGQ